MIKRFQCVYAATFALGLSLFVLGAPNSYADTYILDTNNGCCVAGPYGTVNLTQNGSDEVDVTVTLNSPFKFVQSGFPGAFGFNLSGISAANVGITVSTAGFGVGSGGGFDGFGNFQFAITGPSPSSPNPGPLSFQVTNTAVGGTISVSQFALKSTNPPGSKQAFFAADINDGSGSTGVVGAVNPGTPSVPEPSAIGLFGTGLVGAVLTLRKRFRRI